MLVATGYTPWSPCETLPPAVPSAPRADACAACVAPIDDDAGPDGGSSVRFARSRRPATTP